MGKKKSNSQKNAFYYFMLHIQSAKKGGRTITLREAADIAGEKWQKMNAAERAPFEKKAEIEKQNAKGEKYTSQGVPFSVLDAQKEADKLDADKKNLEINNSIYCAVNNNAIDVLDFCIIDVNIFVETSKRYFVPAEIALSKFNLKDGIHSTFHTLIDPGEIPTGYSFEAKSYTNESHQLPLPPDASGESDMKVLFTKVMSFLMHDRTSLPPLYTIKKQIHHTKGFLLQLCNELGFDDSEIRVYNIAEAFLILRNVCSKFGVRGTPVYLNLAMAEMEIEKDVYDYYKYLACDYHEQTDVLHMCSLSRVKRWGFIIADNCCKDLEIKMVLGKHLPIQAALPNEEYVSYSPYEKKSVSSSWSKSGPSSKISENKSMSSQKPNVKQFESSTSDEEVTEKFNCMGIVNEKNTKKNESEVQPAKNSTNATQIKNQSTSSSSTRLPKPESKFTAAKLFGIGDNSNDDDPNAWTTVQSKKSYVGLGRGRGVSLRKN